MKRSTYEAMLTLTVVTDDDTIRYAKEAARMKAKLLRYWQKAALAYIKETTGRDLEEERGAWTELKYPNLTLHMTGNVTVDQWIVNEWDPPDFHERFTVPKRLLLKEG